MSWDREPELCGRAGGLRCTLALWGVESLSGFITNCGWAWPGCAQGEERGGLPCAQPQPLCPWAPAGGAASLTYCTPAGDNLGEGYSLNVSSPLNLSCLTHSGGGGV